MTFQVYCIKYNRAYDKQLDKINVLEPRLTKETLQDAYDRYCDPTEEFKSAFKPAAIAQSNVVFYDYQIKAAYEAELGRLPDDETLLYVCRRDPDAICDIVRDWYKKNSRD